MPVENELTKLVDLVVKHSKNANVDFCQACVRKIICVVRNTGNINRQVLPFACPDCKGTRHTEEVDCDWDHIIRKKVRCKKCEF